MSIKKYSATSTWTDDSLFSGKIICYQNRNGYRFSIDPVLLSHFLEINENDRIVDLGTGSGVMPLILLYRHFEDIHHIKGIEIQDNLCALADHNIKSNRFEKKASVVQGDIKCIRDYFRPESYDKVICNPPFFKKNTGRLSTNLEAQIARHEIKGDLQDFITAAAFCLKNRACAYFVYPAEKINYFLNIATKTRLEPKQIQFIYSYPGSEIEATLARVRCVKNGKSGVTIMSPFFIYSKKNGPYTSAMQNYYE